MDGMENIAKRVIEKLGGYTVVSQIAGVDVSQVYRWTYSKKRGGTGGLIPAPYQQLLKDWAEENDKELTSDDFFRVKETKPSEARF